MVTRTIPANYPLVRPDEGWAGQIIKASIVRKLAQAQNYMWANLRQVYAMGGVEGYGSKRIFSWSEQPGIVTLPNGTTGLPLVSFMVPKNWAGGTSLRIKGNSVWTDNLVKNATNSRVIAWLYELSGSPTTVNAQSSNVQTTGTWSFDMPIPQDADMRYITVYLQSSATQYQGAAYDALQITNVSARYITTTLDTNPAYGYVRNGLNATPALPVWDDKKVLDMRAYSGAAGSVNSASMSSVFWDWIINNTNAMWFEKNPELCQATLKETNNNTTSMVECCRYYAYVQNGVGSVTLMLDGYRDTTVNGSWQVKLNGAVVGSGTVTGAGVWQGSVTFTPVAGAENTITIETSVASVVAGKWGMLVWNVSAWEHNITVPGYTGVALPASYVPLDEDELQGDLPVRLDHFQMLAANDRWLYKNRPRHIIGDCCHKTYKRSGTRLAYTTQVDPYVDWTPGFPDFAYQLGSPKNITVRPEGVTIAGSVTGGLAGSPNGLATTTDYLDYSGQNYLPSYPGLDTYVQHGLNLARVRLGLNSNEAGRINRMTTAKLRTYARGRRATTKNIMAPLQVEEQYFVGLHSFKLYCNANVDNPTLNLCTLPIVSPDKVTKWVGNDTQIPYTVAGTYATILVNGYVPKPVSYFDGGNAGIARITGMLFETELQSLFISDAPLTPADLAAL